MYQSSTNCRATYKLGPSCKAMMFKCTKSNINSKDNRCKKGDKMIITAGGKTKRYCKTKKPSAVAKGKKGIIKVLFKSDKKTTSTGSVCKISCTSNPVPTPAPTPPAPTPTPAPTPAPTTGGDLTLSVEQTWSQELDGYNRTAVYSIPENSQSSDKFPVVIDLHGNGGQADLRRSGYLGDACIIVAANGYERSWNIYSENSKAPDVDFIKDLITKISEEIPQADMSDVTLIGTSNGAGLIYRLLIEIENPRPFHRVIPTISSMINKQYHDDSFWKPSVLNNLDENNFDTATVPSSPGPQILHFHGTEDGTVPYVGGGGAFLGDTVDFLSAQENDFLFAKAFGYDGEQIPDAQGVMVMDRSDIIKNSYLDDTVVHYKLVGAAHNAFSKDFKTDVHNIIREAIVG